MANELKKALDDRLTGIVLTDALHARIVQAACQEGEPKMKRRLSLSLAVVLALVLLTAAAFALTRGFGLFDLMGKDKTEEFATVQPEAYDLVYQDLAGRRFGDIEVTVYDGKYLRVVHATRDLNAKEPFDADAVWNGNFTFEAAEKEGVWWNSLDWAIVNGQTVMPLGEAGATAGPNPGETLAWIQFDLSEMGTLKTAIATRTCPSRTRASASTWTCSKPWNWASCWRRIPCPVCAPSCRRRTQGSATIPPG